MGNITAKVKGGLLRVARWVFYFVEFTFVPLSVQMSEEYRKARHFENDKR